MSLMNSQTTVPTRRHSVSLCIPHGIANGENGLNVAVWNVQDFGAGPSGRWAGGRLEEDLPCDEIDSAVNVWVEKIQKMDPDISGRDYDTDERIKAAIQKSTVDGWQPPAGVSSDPRNILRYGLWKRRIADLKTHVEALKADVAVILEVQLNASRDGTTKDSDVDAKIIDSFDQWLCKEIKSGNIGSLADQAIWDGYLGEPDLLERLQSVAAGKPPQETYYARAVCHRHVSDRNNSDISQEDADKWDKARAEFRGVVTSAVESDPAKWLRDVDRRLWDYATNISVLLDLLESGEKDVEFIIPFYYEFAKAYGPFYTPDTLKTKLTAMKKWMNIAQKHRRLVETSDYFETTDASGSGVGRGKEMFDILKSYPNPPDVTWHIKEGMEVGQHGAQRDQVAATSGSKVYDYKCDGETIIVRVSNGWNIVGEIVVKGLQSDERPCFQFTVKKDGNEITIVAIHAPAPARIPKSTKLFENLSEYVHELHELNKKVILMGDMNTGETELAHKDSNAFLTKFYSSFDPPLATHSQVKTTVKMKGKLKAMWSQAYDKVLVVNGGELTGSSLEVAKNWDDALRVRRYSDHCYVTRKILIQRGAPFNLGSLAPLFNSGSSSSSAPTASQVTNASPIKNTRQPINRISAEEFAQTREERKRKTAETKQRNKDAKTQITRKKHAEAFAAKNRQTTTFAALMAASTSFSATVDLSGANTTGTPTPIDTAAAQASISTAQTQQAGDRMDDVDAPARSTSNIDTLARPHSDNAVASSSGAPPHSPVPTTAKMETD